MGRRRTDRVCKLVTGQNRQNRQKKKQQQILIVIIL